MITISLCMIVKNEETVLARCLNSIKDLVDEIIIVDTGSEDKTRAIAREFTDKVYDFEWIDDFAAARNFAFSKGTKEYCMWLDADDVIDQEQQRLFAEFKKNSDPKADIVMMKYNTAFDENGNPVFSYYRERLIKNNGQHIWMGAVHEAIVPNGKVVHSEIAVSHRKIGAGDPDRNLNIYRKQLAEHKVLEPRHQYYYARELYYHNHFEEALKEFEDFLGKPDGWVENKIEACTLAAACSYRIGDQHKAIQILFQSFQYDTPRAEICCDIGKHFLTQGRYKQAIYWYEKAAAMEADLKNGGFTLLDCYDYIPYLQICVCYDRLGDTRRAWEYNEKAGSSKPGSKAYLHNRSYFEKKLKTETD